MSCNVMEWKGMECTAMQCNAMHVLRCIYIQLSIYIFIYIVETYVQIIESICKAICIYLYIYAYTQICSKTSVHIIGIYGIHIMYMCMYVKANAYIRYVTLRYVTLRYITLHAFIHAYIYFHVYTYTPIYMYVQRFAASSSSGTHSEKNTRMAQNIPKLSAFL